LLSALEAQKKLQYTLADQFETNKPQTYLSYGDIPDFGHAKDPSAIANPCYLVAVHGNAVRLREIRPRAGGVRFSVDQKLNQDTVCFWPGGRHRENVLLYGKFGTIWETSEGLYNFFAEPFHDRFTAVREFLVGPEAFRLWQAGVRLTIAVDTPHQFDLKP